MESESPLGNLLWLSACSAQAYHESGMLSANDTPQSKTTVTFFGRAQVTLAQGSGARRLAEVRCRAAIQLLLVQASGEIYAAHSQRLPQAAAILMLDALADMAQHARRVDADLDMRRDLAAAQAESKVRRSRCNAHSLCLRSKAACER